MSLDTVLQIGKVFRQSTNSLKNFQYVSPCPKDINGNWPICLTLPVKEDFSFDFANMYVTPENERENLYYLKFKTSDADGLVKYIYGDIYYSRSGKLNKNGSIETKEGGYYRLANPNHPQSGYRPSSFNRGNADFNSIVEKNKYEVLNSFRDSMQNNLKVIEAILLYAPTIISLLDNNHIFSFDENEIERLYELTVESNYNEFKTKVDFGESGLTATQKKQLFDLSRYEVFLHFEFPGKKHWYHYQSEVDAITGKILSEFVEPGQQGLVLKKTLYKTLCSGDAKNDIQFPFFTSKNKYKSKVFSSEELKDLFYAIDYSSKGRAIPGTDIKLIVLPRGEGLTEKDYLDFQKDWNEHKLSQSISYEDDVLFGFVEKEKDNNNIISFDLIFCKKRVGVTSPDTDLIEISGIRKSKIKQIHSRISTIAETIDNKRKDTFNRTDKQFPPFNIEKAFRFILGDPQFDEKAKRVEFRESPTLQSHLLKILPLIYTENYYNDNILLPYFIRNCEYIVRMEDSNSLFFRYILLRYNLQFLFNIQNSNTDRMKKITDSGSYKLGLLLGGMAKNLSGVINSFEKNYVGNLTRRIATLSDFIKLKNEIEQKLILHDKAKFTFQSSYDLAQLIKDFSISYDKEQCAFGFFEGYFKPIPKKDTSSVEENVENNV